MMVASTTLPSHSSRTFSLTYCPTVLKIFSANWCRSIKWRNAKMTVAFGMLSWARSNPGEGADGAAVNQGVFGGFVPQRPPVLHQVNP